MGNTNRVISAVENCTVERPTSSLRDTSVVPDTILALSDIVSL